MRTQSKQIKNPLDLITDPLILSMSKDVSASVHPFDTISKTKSLRANGREKNRSFLDRVHVKKEKNHE